MKNFLRRPADKEQVQSAGSARFPRVFKNLSIRTGTRQKNPPHGEVIDY